jgi:hypothetical protein
MVKRLILLVILLTLSLPSFSQTVTQSKDSQVVVLPVKVAREVVKDLMRGDSAIAQLSLANIQITQLELKVTYQDSVIQKLKSKEDNYITLVESEKRKNEILNDEIKTTQKELRKVKTKKTFSQIISGAIILTLSYLYITK